MGASGPRGGDVQGSSVVKSWACGLLLATLSRRELLGGSPSLYPPQGTMAAGALLGGGGGDTHPGSQVREAEPLDSSRAPVCGL